MRRSLFTVIVREAFARISCRISRKHSFTYDLRTRSSRTSSLSRRIRVTRPSDRLSRLLSFFYDKILSNDPSIAIAIALVTRSEINGGTLVADANLVGKQPAVLAVSHRFYRELTKWCAIFPLDCCATTN